MDWTTECATCSQSHNSTWRTCVMVKSDRIAHYICLLLFAAHFVELALWVLLTCVHTWPHGAMDIQHKSNANVWPNCIFKGFNRTEIWEWCARVGIHQIDSEFFGLIWWNFIKWSFSLNSMSTVFITWYTSLYMANFRDKNRFKFEKWAIKPVVLILKRLISGHSYIRFRRYFDWFNHD